MYLILVIIAEIHNLLLCYSYQIRPTGRSDFHGSRALEEGGRKAARQKNREDRMAEKSPESSISKSESSSTIEDERDGKGNSSEESYEILGNSIEDIEWEAERQGSDEENGGTQEESIDEDQEGAQEDERTRRESRENAQAAEVQEEDYVRPPDLREYKNFGLWRRAYQFWKSTTKLSSGQRAAELMEMIGNKMEGYPDGLKQSCIGAMTEDQIREPSDEVVMEILREQVSPDEEERLWETFKEYQGCRIKPGEKYTDFISRFEEKWAAVRNRDPDCSMSDKMLAMTIRERAGLKQQSLVAVKTVGPCCLN